MTTDIAVQNGLHFLHLIASTSSMKAALVGGCVRDWYQGRDTNDLDVAIDHAPEDVIVWAKKQGLPFFPVGIAHGTVGIFYRPLGGMKDSVVIQDPKSEVPCTGATLLPNGYLIQVTMLRKDICATGRHATVAFTHRWEDDAHRRDFTMNSLYLNKDKRLFDPCGGRYDLDHKILRFIGNPIARIQEDFLRIMRFFRFSACIDMNVHHHAFQEGLDACYNLKDCTRELSKQRIGQEMLKLLEGKNWHRTIALMQSIGMDKVLVGKDGFNMFNISMIIEQWFDSLGYCHIADDDPFKLSLIRLCALCYGRLESNALKNAFALSRSQCNFMANLCQMMGYCTQKGYGLFWLRRHYSNDLLKAFVVFCSYIKPDLAVGFMNEWEEIKHHSFLGMQIFPLRGRDIMNHCGIVAGMTLGEVLKKTKQWWFLQQEAPSYNDCLSYAVKIIESNNRKFI